MVETKDTKAEEVTKPEDNGKTKENIEDVKKECKAQLEILAKQKEKYEAVKSTFNEIGNSFAKRKKQLDKISAETTKAFDEKIKPVYQSVLKEFNDLLISFNEEDKNSQEKPFSNSEKLIKNLFDVEKVKENV